MARFFFDVIDHINFIDREGTEFPSLASAKVEGMRFIGEMLRDADERLLDVLSDFRLQIRDEAGRKVFTVALHAKTNPAEPGHRERHRADDHARLEHLVEEARRAVESARALRRE